MNGLKHTPLESCKDYLPKPRKRLMSVVVQCDWCKRLYVGDWEYSFYWKPVQLKGESK